MLSLSIVTFNSANTIAQTLESLWPHLSHRIVARLVLIDNGSSDGTPALLKSYSDRSPRVTLILNQKNRGYGRAHNQALPLVASRYHAICNPDIVFRANVFTPQIQFMESSPRVGILCPRFVNSDGNLQPLNRRNPTLLDLFLRRFLPAGLKPMFLKRLEAYEMRDVGYQAVCEVPFMSGAYMLCRTQVLKEVGGFDERFFLYFEDADLSRRVQNIGFKTVYVPDTQVIHGWERMAHRNWKMAWIFSINALRYFHKWGFRLW